MFALRSQRVITRGLTALVLLMLAGCSSPPPPMPTPEATPTMPSVQPIPSAAIALSGEWRFAVNPDGRGEQAGWASPGFDDAAWTTVTVPHTWNVVPEYSNYEGLAWYRRKFAIPAAAGEAHLRLHFDAVFYRATVWLNGERLGGHDGGYTPFEFDVSRSARPGAENVLAVQVDNRRGADRIPARLRPDWSFDWWNYGGIVRDVSLLVTSHVFIARQQIVAVPQLSGVGQAASAVVTVTVDINNTTDLALDGRIVADVRDDTGRPVLSAPVTAVVRADPDRRTPVQLAVTIPQPQLWHFDHPNLYRWSASLQMPDGTALHAAEATFGIRTVELKAARLLLNGEPVRLVGLSRHADSPEHGLAETTTIMAADYADLKTLNEVLSRPVHYPQHEFILDYCDRYGILLIPEVPAWQLTAQQMADPAMRTLEKQQLREMIEAGFNHPSVWAWSVGNELESETRQGREFVREMIAYVKALDPTRPVGFASNRLYGRPQEDATALADLVLMNQYFGTWGGSKQGLGPALDWIHQTWPDKAVIVSEFGFEPRWNRFWGPPTSTLDPDQYYFLSDEALGDPEAADAVRQRLIAEQMAVLRTRPFVAGAIFWTYQDYRTASGFKMGVVDEQRQRRGSWQVLREEYAPAQFVAMAPTTAPAGAQAVTVRLRVRGPVASDLPAYTLTGYRLAWTVTSPDAAAVAAQGELPLPVLAPADEWTGRLEWPGQDDYRLILRLLRPTGFVASEVIFSPDRRASP